MPIDAKAIFTEALALPPQAREELAERLWLSLDQAEQEEIRKSWVEEIDKRVEAFENGEATAILLADALANIRKEDRHKMTVLILSAAYLELDEAASFYEGKQEGLGEEFLQEFDKAVQRIVDFPQAWPKTAKKARVCLTDRFP